MNKEREIIKDNDLDNVHGGTKSPPLKDIRRKKKMIKLQIMFHLKQTGWTFNEKE